jgi:predicted RNA-binding protein
MAHILYYDMEKRKYWLFVTSEENWKTIKRRNIFGFNEKSKKDLDKLNLKDVAIIYIKGKKIGGIFEIVSLQYTKKIKFAEGEYPYMIELRKIKLPKESLEVTDKLIQNISIFKGKLRWGTILMGRATKQINQEDYLYIKELM